ncbi:MAG: hypothetical protein ACI90U_001372 [Pseudomonadales bacterium]|jgi:hypothetical protein
MTTYNVTPLMPSRIIKNELDRMAANAGVDDIKTMAVLAGLKLCFPFYSGDTLKQVGAKLARLDDVERKNISKKIHPVICAMKLQMQKFDHGSQQFLAENPHPSGVAGFTVLLTQAGSEIFSSQANAA